MLTNTFEKKVFRLIKPENGSSQTFLLCKIRHWLPLFFYFLFFLFPYSFKAALRQNHEVSGTCLQGSFLQLSSLFLYSFKSPWLPFLPESRVLELSGLFSNEKPFINLQPGGLPLKGPELEEKPKGKPDTSCETLDISVVLSFTFSICKMEEHSLQNSPSYLLPHQVSAKSLLLGRSSQTSIPKKPLLSPL